MPDTISTDWRFILGQDFRRVGHSITDCPFFTYGEAAAIWRAGWEAGAPIAEGVGGTAP